MKVKRKVIQYISATLLTLQIAPPMFAATPPAPDDASNINLNEGSTEYIISDESLIYDQETHFQSSSSSSNIALTFKGATGSEKLVFKNVYNSKGYFSLESQGSSQLTFENLGDISMTKSFYGSSTINLNSYGDACLLFKNINGNVDISNSFYMPLASNDAEIILKNAGPNTTASIIFDRISGDVIFYNNHNNTYGVIAIMNLDQFNQNTPSGTFKSAHFTNINGSVIFSENNNQGSCIFIDNFSGGQNISAYRQSDIIFQNIEKGVQFINNTTQSHGGSKSGSCFYINTAKGNGSAIFDRIKGDVHAFNNHANSLGGVFLINSEVDSLFSMTNIEGNVLFHYNSALGSGGIGFMDSSSGSTNMMIGNILGDVIFSNNASYSDGGVFYLQGSTVNVSIGNVAGDIIFENNYSNRSGGVIQTMARTGGSNILLSADGGNIVFRNNTQANGAPNAMTLFGSSDVQLRAQEGRSITFYDPIDIRDYNPGVDTHLLEINKENAFQGQIVFSGTNISPNAALRGDINVHNGTLRVEQGAMLGSTNVTDTVTLKGGVMDIVGTNTFTKSTIAAQNINFEGGTLRIGEHSRFDAVDIDMTQGLNVDLAYYLPAANTRAAVTMPHNGLQITADTLSMGGILTIADTTDEFYYTNRFWAQDTDFILFNTTEVDTINGTFDAILSELTGTSVVADPYQYQGEWSLELLDGQLVAHWTATGGIEEIRPEMDGTAMLNTLWSTASNVQAMGRAGAAQMGVHRFKYGKDRNFWGQGLADFSSHGRRGGRDGYDYNGGGYAVGMDHRMGKRFVTGFGVGQLKGDNRSRGYNIKTSQDTFMGMLYTEYNHQLNKKNNLDIQLIGVYGNTTNKSRTTYNRGVSQGKWDNDAWMLDLYATWTRDLGSNWSLTPYIGLEYTIANQDGFTETGYAARRFNSDKMRNLAIPVGMGVAKLVSFNNGMHWLNELKVSYVPDLYRKNPETQAEWLDQEFTWYAKGVAPVRNAARIEYNSRLQLSQRWSLYGGYMYEGRRNATYHQVNLGASYSF